MQINENSEAAEVLTCFQIFYFIPNTTEFWEALTLSSVPCRAGHDTVSSESLQASGTTGASSKLLYALMQNFITAEPQQSLMDTSAIGHSSLASPHSHVAGLIQEPVEGLLLYVPPLFFILLFCLFYGSELI